MKNVGKCGKDGKPITMGKAMREAGYSESYSKNGSISKTASWNEQLEAALPDSLLLKVHKEGLEAKRTIHATEDGIISDLKEVDDFTVRAKYTDMGYKLKNRYEETINIKGKIGSLSDEELEGKISGILSGVIGAIAGTRKKKK